MTNRLLVISYRFPPEPYPLATRVEYILNHLEAWDIDAITAAENPAIQKHVNVIRVPPRVPERTLSTLQRLRLNKFKNLLVWPDRFVGWILPAYQKARQLLEEKSYDAILVFMMPYSQGLVGVLLKKHSPHIPLVLNLNDSPTCTGQNPQFPTWLHYRMTRWLEDRYVRSADAVIYVSKTNMDRVRKRQAPADRSKFHLIRRGSKPHPPTDDSSQESTIFRIVYTGGTGGWYQHWEDMHPPSLPKRAYHYLNALGTHNRAKIDHRTHNPVYVGRAIQQVLRRRPEWRGRIRMDVYGGRLPDKTDQKVLTAYGLDDLVHLHGAVPHREALQQMNTADLLFMSLPARLDGTEEERISSKTYEYLMTDRPILAALPPGENRKYLADKPGVHLIAPRDVDAMAEVIEHIADRALQGAPQRIDRSALQSQIDSASRAAAFEQLLEEVVADESPPARTGSLS